MEESTNINRSSGSWWGFSSVLDKVKRTSENIISIYKEDLTEFSRTIQNDTKEVIKKTTEEESLETITSSITGFFGFSQNKTENKETATTGKRGVIVDRHQARILQLQTELSTYCTEPTDQEDFVAWKQQFKVSNITDDISRLLASNDKIREIHTKLVPVAVSYTDFWERYFYKLHKLNQEEERRAALVKRATTSEQVDEEDLRWDDEESGNKAEVAKKEEVEDYFQKIELNENKAVKPEKEKEQEKDNDKITSSETLASADPTVSSTQPIPTPVEPHVMPTSPAPIPSSSALESPRGEEISKKIEKKESKIETEEQWDSWE